jgi:hypothetical protein
VSRLSTIVLVPAGRVRVPALTRFHPAGAVKVLDDDVPWIATVSCSPAFVFTSAVTW